MGREVTWSNEDNCYIARENGLATHGDTEESAIVELEIVLKMAKGMNREELREGLQNEYLIVCRNHYRDHGYPYNKSNKEWLEDKVIYLLNDVVPTMAKHIENRNEKITELEDTIDKFVLEVD